MSYSIAPQSTVSFMAKCFVVLQAVLFVTCGVIGLFNPVGLMDSMDVGLNSAVAITEIRATYGGFLLGAGLLILYAAFSEIKMGLIAVILLLASAGITRFVGLYVDRGESVVQWFLLAVELASVAIAVALLIGLTGRVVQSNSDIRDTR